MKVKMRVCFLFIVIGAVFKGFFCIPSITYAEAEHYQKADKIIVYKSKHELQLLHQGKVIKSYAVALGKQPQGPKTQQGDNKTPEGLYTIDARNSQSRFYKALHISYPNQKDRGQARRVNVNPGGDILIHGLPNALGFLGRLHLFLDWTKGCIAVTNQEIDEIWQLVDNGTPIEIRP